MIRNVYLIGFGMLACACLAQAEVELAIPVAADAVNGGVPVEKAPVVVSNHHAIQYMGVVKIETDALTPNYAMPWQPGDFQSSTGTGFYIGNKRFMTNAHVVSNEQRMNILLYGDSRKIPAKVKFVAHDADLAIIEIEDDSAFAKVVPFEFSESLPKLEDQVRVIGYPKGGSRLAVTRGVVSRIDFQAYSHPRYNKHLVVQVDAAINPGNSGGPALLDDKVIGVAFQGMSNANSTGYIIPVPVVKRFLKDVEDGAYDGYVSLGFEYLPIENMAMRKALKLPDNEKGVLVGTVFKGGSADSVLKTGDVVLKIANLDVDSSGMVQIEGERINMPELAERCFKGEKFPLLLMRDGTEIEAEITLVPSPGENIMPAEYDKRPRYVVCAGLVFQPAQRDVFGAHDVQLQDIAWDLKRYKEDGGCLENEDLVLLCKVLDDEINAPFTESVNGGLVDMINGVKVKGLNHLYALLYPAEMPEFLKIEIKGNPRPIVLETKALKEANERIAKKYKVMSASCLDSSRESPRVIPEQVSPKTTTVLDALKQPK